MTAARLPAFMALATILVMVAGVSCCPPQPAPVVMPCPPLKIPPVPTLPMKDYHPTWTREQLLSAYAQTTALLYGWQQAAIAVMQAHNAPQSKK